MNVLYIYRESNWGKELKYSLRSVNKYVNPDTVYVVGDEVPFDVVNIKVPERRSRYRDACNLLTIACKEIIDEELLLMHDDMFLLAPYKRNLRYDGMLKDRIKGVGGERKEVFENTMPYLYEPKNFALHYPLPFKVDLMRAICEWIPHPLSYMNAYGNLDTHFVPLESKDCKFNPSLLTKEFLQDMTCFSTYNEDDSFEDFLKSLYPKPSQYE